LKSEVERIRNSGENVVFDVDVVGGINIKKLYGDEALAIFVMPPSIDVLKSRLEGRGTDDTSEINARIDKAEYELTFAEKFDKVIINNELEKAKNDTMETVKMFVG